MVKPRLTDALTNRKVIFSLNMFAFCIFLLAHFLLAHVIAFQVDVAQDLRGILIRIGRFKSLESQYTKVHLKPITKLWGEFDSRQRANKSANDGGEVHLVAPSISFSSWLPSFYDELLLYLEQEWKWYRLCC